MLDDATALLSPVADAETAASLLDSERMEFQASLQLLADRACWISGALAGAIALKENGVMGYRAVSGVSDREPGTEIAPNADPRRECLEEQRPVRVGPIGDPPTFAIAVPVLRDGEAVGFIELTGDREFSDEMTETLSRLADLVTVTLEHCEAAERAEGFEFDNEELSPPIPALWHAPEVPAEAEVAKTGANNPGALEPAKVAAPASTPEIRTCVACGFPVSTGRALCVECERKPESVSVATPLFTAEAEESWLSAHGYSIASLIVTALTAALIVWLRR
jgi:hypothetical protein